MGVIGVAVFPERYVAPPPRPRPLVRPYPYSDPYRYPYDGAGAPESRREESESLGGRDRSGSDEPMSSSPSARGAAPPPAAAQPAPRSSSAADAASEGAGSYGGGRLSEKKAMRADRARPGLGTDYGEAVSSPTYEVEFMRANPARPSVVMGMRYNDRDGLLAMGIDVDGVDQGWSRDEELRRTADPFPAENPGYARRYAAPPVGWRRW